MDYRRPREEKDSNIFSDTEEGQDFHGSEYDAIWAHRPLRVAARIERELSSTRRKASDETGRESHHNKRKKPDRIHGRTRSIKEIPIEENSLVSLGAETQIHMDI